MRNTQNPSPAITYRPLDLPAYFPLFVRLHGERDDEPIRMMHVHNVLEVGFCRSGAGTLFVGSKVLPYQAGDMTLITDLEVHRAQSAPGSKSTWAWFFFQPDLLLGTDFAGQYVYEAAGLAGPGFRNVIPAAEHPALHSILQEMIREATDKSPAYAQSMRALVVVLLNRVHAVFGQRSWSERSSPKREDMERLCPALDRISRAYGDALNLVDLARACHMGVRNFQLVFRRAMECSPQQYLIRTRVRAAQALLKGTDTPITRIALDCGFGSLSSFNRAFRKITGHTPRQERTR